MFHSKSVLATVLAILVIAFSSGCSTVTGLFKDEKPAPAATYEFEDIRVPGELSIDRDNSFVFETKGFKAGTLHFTGYVDADSVTDFFRATMPNDGWRLKSIFHHPKSMLLFEKEGKSCVVIVYEKTILTHAEVWLAPQI